MRALVLFVAAAITAALTVPARAASSYDWVTVYVVAHQDDWQLFMTPSAYRDARAGNKVVFIYMTAGDGGLGIGKDGRQHPYYKAREQGALDAARFVATPDDGFPGEWSTSWVTLNGKVLKRHQFMNTVSYFLELPDGYGNGAGFPGTGHQSLKRLYDADIPKIQSITGQTTYYGWWDVVSTLTAIALHERGPSAQMWLNASDPDLDQNPADHSDHLYSGRAAQDAGFLLCAASSLFRGYSSAGKPVNLADPDKEIEAAVFGVTVSGILRLGHKSNWEPGHRSYLGRSYARSLPSPCG